MQRAGFKWLPSEPFLPEGLAHCTSPIKHEQGLVDGWIGGWVIGGGGGGPGDLGALVAHDWVKLTLEPKLDPLDPPFLRGDLLR